MKTISKMKTLLISVAAVAGLVGASTASASLARVDYEGVINKYVDDAGTGAYDGVLGSSFSGTYLIDTVGSDLRSDTSSFGVFRVSGTDVATVNVGGFSFTSDAALVGIANDWLSASGNLFDGYMAKGSRLIGNELIMFGLSLTDTDANQFSSDSFVAEPALSEFEGNKFYVAGLDITTKSRTFLMAGTLTSLVDPPIENLTPVPAPAPLLLLGSALAALGFSARKKRSDAATA